MSFKKIAKWPMILFITLIAILTVKFEKKENSRKNKRSPATSSEKISSTPERKIASANLKPLNQEQILLNEIAKLSDCYEKQCFGPSPDPRTEYYKLGQQLKIKLAEYNSYVTKYALKNVQINNVALQFLAHSDGHVQEVALDLLSTQDPSEQNLDAILENIINGFDAELIHQAFLELQRYNHPKDLEKIRMSLGQALLHGTPFVALTIAGRINLILNEQNITYFEDLMSNLDPQSRVYRDLKLSIQEFVQVSQSG